MTEMLSQEAPCPIEIVTLANIDWSQSPSVVSLQWRRDGEINEAAFAYHVVGIIAHVTLVREERSESPWFVGGWLWRMRWHGWLELELF